MRTFIQRLGAVSLLLAFSMALVACGNKEAEQRATFITYLQTRVLDKPGLRVPHAHRRRKKPRSATTRSTTP